MDAFGHQELLESLSHNSGGSRSSSKPSSAGRSYASHNGRNLHSLLAANESSGQGGRSAQTRSHHTAHSGAVSHVDEAYRRLGQRLSFQAHGDILHSPSYRPIVVRIRPNDESAFEQYAPLSGVAGSGRYQSARGAPRISKARKVDYSDHGNHCTSAKALMFPLKNLTVNAKETFLQCFENEAASKRIEAKSETLEMSSATALSKLDLAGSRGNASMVLGLESVLEGTAFDGSWSTAVQQNEQYQRDQAGPSLEEAQHSHATIPPAGAGLNNKGLLTSVLEENASVSSGQGGGPSHQSQASRTISTKDSPPKQSIQIQRGRCLTNPSTAVSNDGHDNAEGNLIVHDNDVISVTRKAIKTLHHSSLPKDADYRVVSILGQGTFAQVFQCLHVQTGNVVAVKIVKNKPAYTRQAGMEVDVFRALQDEGGESTSGSLSLSSKSSVARGDYMVNLECYFFYRSHLCLVFEQLSLNLYEVLKSRQFRGFPLTVVRSIIRQAMVGMKDLSSKAVVHCDMKPENILLVSETDVRNVEASDQTAARLRNCPVRNNIPYSDLSGNSPNVKEGTMPRIKLIDFGSACFEGFSSHTYIQSRFYRSPEVLVGVPYDSAIDMWSLGCVAAELYLGLPILPGVHEHDQLGRIAEMIAPLPDWMLEGGTKTQKYFLKLLAQRQSTPVKEAEVDFAPSPTPQTPSPISLPSSSPIALAPQWRLKTHEEYIRSLTAGEIQKKGGMAKLGKQPGNRYFKCKRLVDIVASHAKATRTDDDDLLPCFVHFLYGLLDPDPWKRWTAFQAIHHPFLTGDTGQLQRKSPGLKLNPKEQNLANLALEFVWQGPWDPSICRRKLLSVQKLREKQSLRRGGNGSHDQVADFSFLQAEKRRLQRADAVASISRQSAGSAGRRPSGVSPGAKALSSATSSTASISTLQLPLQLAKAESVPSTLLYERSVTYDRSSSESFNQTHSGMASRTQNEQSSALQSPPDFTVTSTSITLAADFAQALSRPGVVPSTGSVAGDAVSVGSTAFSATGTSAMRENFAPMNQTNPMTWSDSATTNLTFQRGPVYHPSHFSGAHQVSLNGAHPPSLISGAMIPEAPPCYQQVQQHDAQQVYTTEQVGAQQHYPQWQSQLPNSAGQNFPQFQPLPVHQQPVYLSLAPGGGYYYMTSSATGQPILLQPVAVLDQSMQQFGNSGGMLDGQYPHGFEQAQTGFGAMPSPGHPPAAYPQRMAAPHNLQQDQPGRSSHQASNWSARARNTSRFRGGVSM